MNFPESLFYSVLVVTLGTTLIALVDRVNWNKRK